jgi:hypothetical protein
MAAVFARRLLAGAATVGVGGSAYGYYWATTNMGDDAVKRLRTYCGVIVPFVVQYKWMEAKCEKLPKLVPWLFPPMSEEQETKEFNKLHEKWAPPIFDLFMEVRVRVRAVNGGGERMCQTGAPARVRACGHRQRQ